VLSLSLSGLPLGEQLLGLRITPLTDREALEMIQPLSGKAHLEGLQDLLLRVSRLVEELPEVEGLELHLLSQPNDTQVVQAQVWLRSDPAKK